MVKYYLKDFTNTRSDKYAPIITSTYFMYVLLNLNPPEVYFRMWCEAVMGQFILRISQLPLIVAPRGLKYSSYHELNFFIIIIQVTLINNMT